MATLPRATTTARVWSPAPSLVRGGSCGGHGYSGPDPAASSGGGGYRRPGGAGGQGGSRDNQGAAKVHQQTVSGKESVTLSIFYLHVPREKLKKV